MNLLTAIIYCQVPQVNGSQFLKYRNIKDTEAHRRRFVQFAAKFPGAKYVNWYNKKPRQYIGREYIKP